MNKLRVGYNNKRKSLPELERLLAQKRCIVSNVDFLLKNKAKTELNL